jgi:hypothetical protein
MNKNIFQQSGILLSTGDTFVETSNIPLIQGGGILIARISSVSIDELYVVEMVCKYQKDDGGVLTLSTAGFPYEATRLTNFLPTPSFVNSSNNLRIRFTRNAYGDDSNWMVDMDILFLNI